jgi:MFS family permease
MTAPPAGPPPAGGNRTGAGAHLPPGGARILTVLLVPLFMSLMGVSIVNVALPAIESGLPATAADLQWVLAGYSLAFGVSMVPAGRAGDLWGRKPLFITGILVFSAGSLASGLAGDPLVLNLSRVLMGVGSGLLNPQIIGIIQNVFHGRARGRAYGMLGTIVGLGVSIGPSLGGVFIDVLGAEWGWRATFLVNVPIGLVAAALAAYWLRPPVRPQVARVDRSLAALDPVGALLLAATVIGIMVPFILPGTWYLLAASAACAGLWWWWESRVKKRQAATGRAPMVDPALFRIPSFTLGTVATAAFLAATPGLFAVQAIVTQQGLGLSALAAGLTSLPSALLIMVLSPAIGGFVHRHGPVFVVIGAALSLLAMALSGMAFLRISAGDWPFWTLAACLGLLGPAQALVMTSTQVLTMHEVPLGAAGAAGGVSQTAQRVMTAIGLSAVTAAFYASLGVRDAGAQPGQLVYGDAAVHAVIVVAGFLCVTLLAGIVDLVRRWRSGTLSLQDDSPTG